MIKLKQKLCIFIFDYFEREHKENEDEDRVGCLNNQARNDLKNSRCWVLYLPDFAPIDYLLFPNMKNRSNDEIYALTNLF